MPELPEVEVVRMGLEEYIVGKEIVGLEVLVPKIFIGDKKNVIGAKIVSVERVGKGLIINLGNDYAIVVHLKMTGQLIYRGKDTESFKLSPKVIGGLPSKFTCVIFKVKTQNSKLQVKNQNLIKFWVVLRTFIITILGSLGG